MAADMIEIPRSLWTTVCPNCAYSLEGQGSEGTCPECGRKWDQLTVILHGHAIGSHETVGNAKRSRIVWILFLSIFTYWAQFNFFSRATKMFGLIALGAAVAFAVYHLFRRGTIDHPGLIQIRLDHRGCAQYDDLQGPSILHQLYASNVWLVLPVAVVFSIVAFRVGWFDGDAFAMLLFLALVFTPTDWRKSRRIRRALKQVRENAIADINEALCEPVPWRNVTTFDLRSVSDGYRLKVDADFGFWSYRLRTPVDAEIKCTAAQAEDLRELINKWMKQSRIAAVEVELAHALATGDIKRTTSAARSIRRGYDSDAETAGDAIEDQENEIRIDPRTSKPSSR